MSYLGRKAGRRDDQKEASPGEDDLLPVLQDGGAVLWATRGLHHGGYHGEVLGGGIGEALGGDTLVALRTAPWLHLGPHRGCTMGGCTIRRPGAAGGEEIGWAGIIEEVPYGD